ncbi:restriction endonuclease subunit S [Campylobacter fetus]|uniref:restriction endonuclease subunit S n=1 Tax=Campylobacter fetus TaxID=196 RepID=UPI000FCA5ABA|nr:restriction endonuclease subunit S [Campylobacter fetus]RUT49046.1 hypothetical protein BWK67_08330 [Campylobacter fetus]RUT49210.1 hypothetical protein BWK51_08305 [Campylobacter fetus]
MSDYKQTAIGLIPKEWEVVKLGDVSLDGILNGIFNNPKKVGKGIKLINVVNLYNEPYINCSELKLLEVSKKEYDKFSALKGDLFFTRSSLKADGIAHCNLLTEEDKIVFECHIMRVRPKNNIANSYYLFRYCQSFYARKYLISASKTTTMTTIDQNGLYNLPIPLPPLKEQEKIAEILSTWDKAISNLDELIAQKQNLKTALMQNLLSAKIRFKEFSDEWQEVKLGDICEIKKGEQLNKLKLNKYDLYAVINGGISPSGYTDKFNTEANTITISEGGNSCGYVNLIKDKFWSGGHCYTLHKINTNFIFLYQYLKHFEISIMNLRVGSGLPNIQKTSIESFRINISSLPEQQKITEVLSTCDDEINLLKDKLSNLKLQKQGLMQKLLTGKVRVKI